MRAQMSGQVNVEVDVAAQQDLQKVLEEIREQSETLAAKNKREVDNWYQAKVGGEARGQGSGSAAVLPERWLSAG